ncbi:fibronectin type III domain-containing protein [Microbacterium sp. 179-I 3D4 NHS]|uniref:fibronectin type III domain-containing protein n=1 Tax=Microbacterium sp. 179-I 3D4 NHS TaxID=3142381 RepID=UPI0039A3DCDF
MGNTRVRARRLRALSVLSITAVLGASLVVGLQSATAAPIDNEVTFGYTAGTQSWTVPAGVTSVSVEIRGAAGGNGGADATAAPAPGTYRGLVAGTLAVAPGNVLTIGVGQGGATGRSAVAGSTAAAAGGLNPFAGYDGGSGGLTGTKGTSGQGGAGGAATVLRLDGRDVVAAGGGGNGGSGQFAPTRGRGADSTFIARTDAAGTDGQRGLNAGDACKAVGCANDDGGGSGGGGGGAIGGAQGRIEFGAGTSNEWFGYGGSVGSNSTADIATLTSSYEYLASNSGNGSIVIRYQTGTAAAPSAPQGVVGDGTVALSWNAPTRIGQGPIEQYEVQYSTDGGASWTTRRTGSTVTQTTVTDLANGTAHLFRVAAVTPAGTGDHSPASAPLTPQSPPSAPAITAAAPRDAALAVSFTAPTRGAAPTGYQYRVDGGTWVPVASTTSPLTVAGLTNGASARVEIRAVSALGEGAISAPVDGTPRAVPGAPTVASVRPDGTTAAVHLVPGFDGGSPITEYEYRLDGGSWQPTGSPSENLTVEGLSPASRTAIEIRAINAAGPGAASAPVTVAVPALPAALEDVRAEGRDRALSISYGIPQGADVRGVEYSLDEGKTWTTAGTTSPFLITDLVNGTAYDVLVRAVNAAGPGAPTTATATPATVPSAPGVDEVVDNGEGGLALTFSAPVDDGGAPVTGYEYTTDGGKSWRTLARSAAPTVIRTASDETALDQEVEYVIAVRAMNRVGAAPASAARTENGPVPVPLPNAPVIDAVASHPGSLEVSFTPGDNGAVPVDRYEYTTDGSTWIGTGTLSPRFTIPGLVDGTTYAVRVRAVNVSGDGAPSASASGTPLSAPAAPSLTDVTRADGTLTVALSYGANGGSPVTRVEYTLDGAATWVPAGLPGAALTVSGLTNGTAYGIQARVITAVGTSPASNVLLAAPAAAPPAPAVAIVPGDTTLAVTAVFDGDGGSPLTGVEYTIDGGGTWVDTRSLSGAFPIVGLANGTPVTVQVRAINAIGTGPAGVQTATPRTTPDAPTAVRVVGNTASAEVSWTAPAVDGGSPVTGYRATAYTDAAPTTPAATCTSTGSTSCVITGLQNGTAYSVAVAATNAAGTGPQSQPRVSVTPLVRPSAPTLTTVQAGDRSLRVAFTAGSTGGQTLTGYEYTLDRGKTWTPASSSTTPLAIDGLTNGQRYIVQARAITIAGPSPASNPVSGSPYGYPEVPMQIVVTPKDRSAVVSWAPAELNGNALKTYTVSRYDAAAGGTRTDVCSTTETTCTITGLVNGTTYYVSIQTEATQGATVLYSERSDPRVAVTPAPAGTQPTFGPVTSTADGFTVPVTNFHPGVTYSLATAGGTATLSATGVLTVTGLAPRASTTVEVTAARSGSLDATASVYGSALDAAVPPRVSAANPTADGYVVRILAPEPGTAYSIDTTALPQGAVVSVTGYTLLVSGLAPGATASFDVVGTRPDRVPGRTTVTGTALLASGIPPEFGDPVRTADGFSVRIADYDADAVYDAELVLPAGATVTRVDNLITVTGASPGEARSVLVRVSRVGHLEASATVSASALDTGVAPSVGPAESTATGFTIPLDNFDPEAVYTFDLSDLPSQASATLVDGVVVVTGLAPGASAKVGVTATRVGRTPSSTTVRGTALTTGIPPEVGTPVRTADGFTVQIADYDPAAEYRVVAPKGVTVTRAGGTLVVSGLAPGETASLDIAVTRPGATEVVTTAVGTAQARGIAPRLSAPTATADGFEMRILGYDPALEYTVTTTAGTVIRDGDRIIVRGLTASDRAAVTVTASNADVAAGTSAVVGQAAAPVPEPVAGADGADDLAATGADSILPLGLAVALLLLTGGWVLAIRRRRAV